MAGRTVVASSHPLAPPSGTRPGRLAAPSRHPPRRESASRAPTRPSEWARRAPSRPRESPPVGPSPPRVGPTKCPLGPKPRRLAPLLCPTRPLFCPTRTLFCPTRALLRLGHSFVRLGHLSGRLGRALYLWLRKLPGFGADALHDSRCRAARVCHEGGAGLSPCARNTIREAISRDTSSSQHAGHAALPEGTARAAQLGHLQRSPPAQSEDLPPEVWLPTLSDDDSGSSTPRRSHVLLEG